MHKQLNTNENTCQCGNPKLRVAKGFHKNADTETSTREAIGLSLYNKLMTLEERTLSGIYWLDLDHL